MIEGGNREGMCPMNDPGTGLEGNHVCLQHFWNRFSRSRYKDDLCWL